MTEYVIKIDARKTKVMGTNNGDKMRIMIRRGGGYKLKSSDIREENAD